LQHWKYEKRHNKRFASMMVEELKEATLRKLFGYAGYVQAEHDYERKMGYFSGTPDMFRQNTITSK